MGQYLPVLVMLVLGAGFAGVSLVMSNAVSPKRPSAAKSAPYECGIVPSHEPPERFPVSFYIVAMLFIIFDIETVFMIPWAVAFRQLGDMAGLLIIEMFVFIVILAVGYVYIWKRGALQWD